MADDKKKDGSKAKPTTHDKAEGKLKPKKELTTVERKGQAETNKRG